jgi:hypothetical protein
VVDAEALFGSNGLFGSDRLLSRAGGIIGAAIGGTSAKDSCARQDNSEWGASIVGDE